MRERKEGRRSGVRYLVVFLLLGASLLAALTAGVGIGSVSISPGEVFSILLGRTAAGTQQRAFFSSVSVGVSGE